MSTKNTQISKPIKTKKPKKNKKQKKKQEVLNKPYIR